MKVIVLGVGSMGAAACAHLARRGATVLGLDQFEVPHDRGSHHGESRMIRQAYFEHPDYVPLLRRAYELWRELEEQSGRDVLHETGGLYLAPSDADIVAGSLRAAEEHGLPHEILSAAELEKRYPQFTVPDHFVGFFESRAGFVKPEAAIRAHVEVARAHGADIRCQQRVTSWEETEDGVKVRYGNDTHTADHLIISAGAYALPLLQDLGIPLTVTRQLAAWFRPRTPDAFTAERFPSWFLETDAPYGHYGFPLDEQGLVKLALHKPGEETDPCKVPDATAEEEDEFRQFLTTHIPQASGELDRIQTCRYTNSPDGHFILGKHPSHSRITLATGFSGHGYKFASVMGELLSELAMDGETKLRIDFLSPARFG